VRVRDETRRRVEKLLGGLKLLPKKAASARSSAGPA